MNAGLRLRSFGAPGRTLGKFVVQLGRAPARRFVRVTGLNGIENRFNKFLEKDTQKNFQAPLHLLNDKIFR